MKRSVTALLLSFITFSLFNGRSGPALALALEEHGPNCNVETSVECYLDDLKETTCDEFVPVSIDQCDSSLTLTFVFHYCNWNDNLDINIFEDLTEIRLANRAYTDVLDESDMPSNTCRSHERIHIVDTCEKSNVPASIKFEGKVVGAQARDGFYCYGYTWKMWKFPKLFPSPSPTPTLSLAPTLRPTPKPTCSTTTYKPTITVSVPDRPSSLPSGDHPNAPSAHPNHISTVFPSVRPSSTVSTNPSEYPSLVATTHPSEHLSLATTAHPSQHPSLVATTLPSVYPNYVDSKYPSAPPTVASVTTVHPSIHPTKIDLPEPVVILTLECFRESDNAIGSGIFNIPCSLALVDDFEDSGCVRDLQYSYIISNDSDEEVRIELLYVGTDGSFFTLIDVYDKIFIQSQARLIEKEIVRTNLCTARKHDATVIATGMKSQLIVSGVTGYELCIDGPADVRIFSISCKVGILSCDEYIASIEKFDECHTDVTFHYAVENYGFRTVFISGATMSIDSLGYEVLSLEGVDPQFHPQDNLVFGQIKAVNLCSFAGRAISFDLKLMDGDKVFPAHANLDFEYLATSHPTPHPTPHPTHHPPTVAPTKESTSHPTMQPFIYKCTDVPHKVSFKYDGRRCDESDNSQFEMKERLLRRRAGKGRDSSKHKKDKDESCKDFYHPPMISTIVISSKLGDHLYFDDKVCEGDQFDIFTGGPGALIKELEIKIYTTKGKLVQSFPLNISCNNLIVGETFGSLEIVAFE